MRHKAELNAPMQAAVDWEGILNPLRGPTAQALKLEDLLLFELEAPSHPPTLVLRAGTRMPLSARVTVDPRALDVLSQAATPLLAYGQEPACYLQPLVSAVGELGCASALIAPVHVERHLWGCLVACAAAARSFTAGELAIFSLVASCAATLVQDAHLRAETAFRLAQATSLQAISSALVQERSPDAILMAIIDEATRLLDAQDALVLLLEEEGEWFRVCARKGPGLNGLTSGRLSVRDSLNGLVVRTGQPLVSNDVLADPRADHERAERLHVQTVAIAPMRIRDQVIGTIAVHNKRGGPFRPVDVEALCALANEGAIAIHGARLFSELQQAQADIQQKARELQELLAQTLSIQEDERRRIAADVHDWVISQLAGALYEVEACIQRYQSGENIEQQLRLLKQLLNETVEKTRRSIYDLWPVTLDHGGLVPALRELARSQERRTGVRHALRVSGVSCDLPPAVLIAIYRVVQEALNNVQQYAAARHVEISLRFTASKVRIAVRDDGRGFDVQSIMLTPPECHFGLLGMRERALSIGGSIHIVSAPGRGSQVILEVPVPNTGPTKEEERCLGTDTRTGGRRPPRGAQGPAQHAG